MENDSEIALIYAVYEKTDYKQILQKNHMKY